MTVLIIVLTAILIPVLLGEGVDWLPWMATRLIRRAAGHLPLEYRARYEREWKADFGRLPGGKLTKLFFGLRVYVGARRRLGPQLQEKLKFDLEMDKAARVLALAQMTADQAISDARREANETLGRACREADRIVSRAQLEAKDIRAKAKRQP